MTDYTDICLYIEEAQKKNHKIKKLILDSYEQAFGDGHDDHWVLEAAVKCIEDANENLYRAIELTNRLSDAFEHFIEEESKQMIHSASK